MKNKSGPTQISKTERDCEHDVEYEAHTRLFAFLNEHVARSNDLARRKASCEPLTDLEHAELDMLEAMEIARYAELCPKYFKSCVTQEENCEIDLIEERKSKRLIELSSRMQVDDFLSDEEFMELKYIHKESILFGRACGNIGGYLIHNHFLPINTQYLFE